MKKATALLLALVFVISVFSGCGAAAGSGSSAAASEAAQSAASDQTASEAAPAAAEEAESAVPAEAASAAEPAAEAGTVTSITGSSAGLSEMFPCDETVTLTMMWPWVGFYNSIGIEDMSQSVWLQEMEKITNVHLDMTLVADEYQTAFMLMCAGGDLTDIIACADTNYSTGADACVEDDIIIDLSDKLEEYAPNYFEILNNNPDIKKQVATDSGYITSFRYINNEAQTTANIPVIRKDLLDEMGMEIPTTLDEIHECLVAFRDNYGMDSALQVEDTGLASVMSTAFGPYGLYVQDGTVMYDYRTENFKNYVTYMAQLVEDGLVNRDFVSNEGGADYSDAIGNNRSGIVIGMLYSDMKQYENDGVDLAAIPSALSNADEKSEMGDIPQWANTANSTSISATCENWEAAMAFFDYNYSEEGALLANYGVEGVTFEYDADGKPQYTERITANPDMPQVLALMYDCCWGCGYLLDVHNEDSTLTDDELEACSVYESAFSGHSLTYPEDYISLTTDESSEISTIRTDLDTYIEENVAHFIAGDQSLDDFDAFVDGIYSEFDMDQLTAVYQAAYDRYVAR